MSYCTKNALEFVSNRKYRNQILRAIVEEYLTSATPDFVNICQVSFLVQLCTWESVLQVMLYHEVSVLF